MLFQDEILQSTTFPNLFGVDGIVIYGTTEYTNSEAHCSALYTFIQDTYAPTAKSQYDWAVDCSNAQCNGHGQCVDISEGDTIARMMKVPSYKNNWRLLT